jgi:NodT family efflux transporter outer membrane factor (OMF) lipoprotein
VTDIDIGHKTFVLPLTFKRADNDMVHLSTTRAKPRAGRHYFSSLVRPSWLALTVALSGCAVGPDYVAPRLDLTAFHTSPRTDTRKPAPPLDQWWIGFRDPELVTIVERALAQNLDLAASFARIHEARAAAAGASAQLLPTADFNAQAVAENQSIESPLGKIANTFPGYTRDQQDYNVGPAASWEVDLFGGLQRSADAARDEAQAAEADGYGTRISVAAEAADAYLQVRGYQARLKVARDQIDVNNRLLNIVRRRRDNGTGNDREVSQTEALLHQARATVPTLQAGLDAQLNRLDVLMGAQPGTYAKELDAPHNIPLPPAISRTAGPTDLLRRRPDIMAAERRLAASDERIGAAIADYYPKLSLSGALGFESISINQLLTSRAFQPIGSGALSWRLFDFGKIDAEVAQARGANVEALLTYRQAVLRATEDVEDAFAQLTQSELRDHELHAEVSSLTRSRDLSESAYEAGAIPLTDVLDADRQLLTARDDFVDNRAAAARAAVRSFRALGGGWS